MEDCLVCCEKLNKSNHKKIICGYCNFLACKTCVQKYLMESSQDPNCMNCKKIFTRDFLNDTCTKVFINTELKTHRETVLLDRQKCLIPETQPYVILEKEKEKLYNQVKKIEAEKAEISKMVILKDAEIHKIYNEINRLRVDNTGNVVNTLGESSESVRKKFIRKCPMNECKGFLSSRWKCGLCETNICNKCNENMEEIEHICKPENVASMELLNKDTKPCPACGTMICKISGCDLMWCPDCHTAFSWNKGTIDTGVNHNPHYYDYMRSQNGGVMPRNPRDVPCGGLPDLYIIRTQLSRILKTETLTLIYNIHNVITHIQHHELRQNHIDLQAVERGLRVKYLMDKISEIEFKKILQLNEKNREKIRDFRNIYQMFVDVGSDLFRNMVEQLKIKQPDSFIVEQLLLFSNLIIYFNENIKKTGLIYKCVYPGISTNFTWINNHETYLRRAKETEARFNATVI